MLTYPLSLHYLLLLLTIYYITAFGKEGNEEIEEFIRDLDENDSQTTNAYSG